jgi:hypothetical protein
MPGINNWDFAILKDTKVNEGLLVQFRANSLTAEPYPVWNANTNLVAGRFGRITSLNINPRNSIRSQTHF